MNLIHIQYVEESGVLGELYFKEFEISEIRSSAKDANARLCLKNGHIYAVPMTVKDLLVEIETQI